MSKAQAVLTYLLYVLNTPWLGWIKLSQTLERENCLYFCLLWKFLPAMDQLSVATHGIAAEIDYSIHILPNQFYLSMYIRVHKKMSVVFFTGVSKSEFWARWGTWIILITNLKKHIRRHIVERVMCPAVLPGKCEPSQKRIFWLLGSLCDCDYWGLWGKKRW